MLLRPYQLAAVAAAESALAAGSHPVLQLATGTGKSLIIAELAHRLRQRGQRVWVLTHVQQLVEQNAGTYRQHTGARVGIACTGLRETPDFVTPVMFGTIQTVTRPALHNEVPAPQVIVIDEAHRVPHRSGEPGQYDRLLAHYPAAQRVAMTATPWRMDNGRIYGDDPDYFWFNHLAYNYPVAQAVAQGWLSELVGVETEVQLNVEDVTVDGDFNQVEVGEKQNNNWLRAVAESLGELAEKRHHIAVYCPTVAAAMRASIAIKQATQWSTELVTGTTDQPTRQAVFSRFRSGETRVLVSVDALTTGFDVPQLDCIVCLRPTVSSSLWVQIQGRGTRLSPGKKNCLVLDYVGNYLRLGGVDMIETYYRQRDHEQVPAAEPLQPLKREPRRLLPGVRTLVPIDPMTGEAARDNATLTVTVHASSAVSIVPRGASQPVLMVTYACTTAENARIDAARFVNTQRPTTADLEFFNARRLAVALPAPPQQVLWSVRNASPPRSLQVRRRGKYWNVVAEEF